MAGRIRTIKPEWNESESLASCSDAARVLSVALILLADDYGNGRGSINYLAAQTWMYSRDSRETLARLQKTAQSLDELRKIRFVATFEHEGSSYFHIIGWSKHQRVDKPGKSRVPAPTNEQIRESLAKVPGSLAPDHDHDHDHDHDREGESEGKSIAAASAAQPKPARPKRKKPAVEMPAGWKPNLTNHVALAAEAGVDVNTEADKFSDHHAAKGSRFVNWDLAFNSWLRKAKDWPSAPRPAQTLILPKMPPKLMFGGEPA